MRRFTHVDPFEDTESYGDVCLRPGEIKGFTHVDPFEDTERRVTAMLGDAPGAVSPTSIRSRILKADNEQCSADLQTVVSPTSIRSRILKDLQPPRPCRTSRRFHPRRSVRGY